MTEDECAALMPGDTFCDKEGMFQVLYNDTARKEVVITMIHEESGARGYGSLNKAAKYVARGMGAGGAGGAGGGGGGGLEGGGTINGQLIVHGPPPALFQLHDSASPAQKLYRVYNDPPIGWEIDYYDVPDHLIGTIGVYPMDDWDYTKGIQHYYGSPFNNVRIALMPTSEGYGAICAQKNWGKNVIQLKVCDEQSNFSIETFNDNGALVSTPFKIDRATGAVLLAKDPIQPLEAATKQYVDSKLPADAPMDDDIYVRKNGTWVKLKEVVAG